MDIIEIPKYAGAYNDVCYTVECKKEGVLYEVVLMDGEDNVWGIKNLKGQRYNQVNIAGFARRELSVEPEARGRTEWRDGGNRVVNAKIKVRKLDTVLQSITSLTSPLVASVKALDECKILSQRSSRSEISRGESDEIAIIAPGKIVVAVVTLKSGDQQKRVVVGDTVGDFDGTTKGFECGEKEHVFVLELDELDPQRMYNQVSVEIKGGDASTGVNAQSQLTSSVVEQQMESYGSIEYRVVGSSEQDVRICWQNQEGAVDYYTFRGEHSRRVIANRSNSNSASGQRVNRSLWQSETTLRSGIEQKQTVEWLSQIIASPRVWQVVDGGYEPIELVTSELIVQEQMPVSVELKVRGELKKQF